jgi:hypothetical protein
MPSTFRRVDSESSHHIQFTKVLDGGGEEEFILRSGRPAQPPRCIENSSRLTGLASIG